MVRTENLGMVFRAGFKRRKVTALKGLDLEVRQGETFGFLGPNGAGKTTTLKILMGLIYPTSGKAWLMGKELGDVSVKHRLGFLPEQPYFYEYLTASEFLDFYGRLFGMSSGTRKARAAELLALVGLDHARDLQLRKFSKGMLQRIGIAQALINDPELVVLDEPMSGLDPVGRKDVKDIIIHLKERGKTIFFSTHILPDVEVVCDRVAILVKGELRAMGAVGDLLESVEAASVEMTFDGLTGSDLAAVKTLAKTSFVQGSIHTVFFDDGEKAKEAKEMVFKRGGEIISLIPHKRSLEDIFIEEVKKGRV